MKQTIDWHSHWTRKTPGFHEGKANRYLQQYLPLFNLQPGDHIFMPLCGKAVDILWLSQQGYQVIGVELSEVAITSFFEESSIDFTKTHRGDFVTYKAKNITLHQGNFMHLQASQLRSCKLIYDRASLVAIEQINRESYSKKMIEINPLGTPMLLIALKYDQSIMQGPPFSVPDTEIRQLYKGYYELESLQANEQIEERSKWKELGLKSLIESAFKLTAV